MPLRSLHARWLLVLLFFVTGAYAVAENITLTTYYPSPRGVYQQLRATTEVDIMATPSSPIPVGRGRLIIGGSIYGNPSGGICPEGSVWEDLNNSGGAPQNGECRDATTINAANTQPGLYFGGTDVAPVSRVIVVGNNFSPGQAGNPLTLRAGTPANSNNLNGGNLLLESGTSTGNGTSQIQFYTVTPNQGSGTTLRNPSEKMRILGNGNVGIGTITPGSKLTVQGSSDATQVVIAANAPQSNSNPLLRLTTSAGAELLRLHSDDNTNVFLGLNAGNANTTGVGASGTFIGSNAGVLNTSGFGNTAIGARALRLNTTGTQNVAVGMNAMLMNTTSWDNTAVGTAALAANTTGRQNAAVGSQGLAGNTSGQYNTAVGADAGLGNTTGSNNVFLGYGAGSSAPAGASNQLWIANTSGGLPLIYGDFSAGNVGIGTNAPVLTLALNDTDTGFNATPGTLRVLTDNVQRMKFRSDGGVDIGEDANLNPGNFSRLQVHGAIEARSVENTFAGAALYLTNTRPGSSNFWQMEHLNSGDLVWYTPVGGVIIERMRLTRNGRLSTTGGKAFKIPHPLFPETMELVHGAIEGPEYAVYYRGETTLADSQATIMLPRYFEALTRKDQRTILLTAKNGWSPLYVEGKVADGRFVVKTTSDGNPSQAFYWELKAVRADLDPLDVEIKKEPRSPQ